MEEGALASPDVQDQVLEVFEILMRDNVLVMHHELVEVFVGDNDFVTPGPSQKALKAVFESSQCQAGVMGLTDDCLHFKQHLSVDVGAHSWACHQAVQELLLFWVWGNERPTIVMVMAIAVSV
jgi:hypothetical protein